MFNLKKIFAELNTEYMYHSTNKNNLKSILKNGLLINSKKNFTINDYILEIYKSYINKIPIFLSKDKKDMYSDSNSILFKVNITNLSLIADFGTLTEYGAYLEEDHFWFEENSDPEILQDFAYEKGSYYYEDFIYPGSAANSAIELTKTAACIENIDLKRLNLLNEI